jgi:hypothetical protein
VIALDNAKLHRIVERQALVDGLTGLANRRQAEDALASEVSRAGRFGGPLAVVLADLDDFKAVNDAHGHPVGDTVLREFAAVLARSVRDVDIAARWAGRSSCSSCRAPTPQARFASPSGSATTRGPTLVHARGAFPCRSRPASELPEPEEARSSGGARGRRRTPPVSGKTAGKEPRRAGSGSADVRTLR